MNELAIATVDVNGTSRLTSLAYLPEATVGDWVVTQTGFAVTLLDEASALESLRLFGELGVLGANPDRADPSVRDISGLEPDRRGVRAQPGLP